MNRQEFLNKLVELMNNIDDLQIKLDQSFFLRNPNYDLKLDIAKENIEEIYKELMK